jgi:hypothetical protein
MSRKLVLLCSVLLVAAVVYSAAAGYVVILKNGTKIRAREAMQIDGDNAIITLVTGTVTSIDLSQVDLVATERYNQLGFGNALILEELSTEGDQPRPTPTPKLSLGSYASIDARNQAVLGSSLQPTPTPTPGIRLQTTPYHDPRVTEAFNQVFDDRHFYLFRTSTGTHPDYLFIQAVTDSQDQVFEALNTVTEAYSIIHRVHPEGTPLAVELEMVDSSGKPAGTFRITLEQAERLRSGETSVEKFYVQHVIF